MPKAKTTIGGHPQTSSRKKRKDTDLIDIDFMSFSAFNNAFFAGILDGAIYLGQDDMLYY